MYHVYTKIDTSIFTQVKIPAHLTKMDLLKSDLSPVVVKDSLHGIHHNILPLISYAPMLGGHKGEPVRIRKAQVLDHSRRCPHHKMPVA